MIARVEFIGFTVTGPRSSARSGYKQADWQGWSVSIEGGRLLLRNDNESETDKGRIVSVPLSHCVVYQTPDEKPKEKR